MHGGLTEKERAEYHERGFFVRSVLREPELAELRAQAEQIHARIEAQAAQGEGDVEQIDGRRYQRVLGSLVKWEWSESLQAVRSMEPVHFLSPAFDALIDDPRLCEPAAELCGSRRVSLFTDKLNFKRPGGSPFPWHQDAPYWAFACAHLDRLASVQIYLDAATEENGCLWLIPGSHRFGHLPAPADRGVLGRLYTDVERLELAEPFPLVGPGGTAVFFHPYLVHGSQRNRTASSRRALVLTYQPDGLPCWNSDAVRVPLEERVS